VSEAANIATRLRRLLPLLEHGKETHVQWRNYLRHPLVPASAAKDVGDAHFHQKMVEEYDERIGAVSEAIGFLERER
jgi:CRISPR/Cas system CMR subunit Cmr6 (Cas7 group RAMP superfamily)